MKDLLDVYEYAVDVSWKDKCDSCRWSPLITGYSFLLKKIATANTLILSCKTKGHRLHQTI